MRVLKKSWLQQRKEELGQKHNARKPPQPRAKFFSRITQVFQPRAPNAASYAERNQTKTRRVEKHINKNVQVKD